MSSRRVFLGKAVAGGVALSAFSFAEIVRAAKAQSPLTIGQMKIKSGSIILFQGDSITDSERDRAKTEANSPRGLGTGYPFLCAAELLRRHSDKHLSFYNRAVSGEKTFQLLDRWEVDCIALTPHVVSLLIGVNDFWHNVKGEGTQGTAPIYEKNLRALLDKTRQSLPQAQLLLGEPFYLSQAKQPYDTWWIPEYTAYRETAARLAKEYNACFIPYQAVFDEACRMAPATYWSPDGVHVTMAGAQLMAEAWMQCVR